VLVATEPPLMNRRNVLPRIDVETGANLLL
jgi:hypothetical protein